MSHFNSVGGESKISQPNQRNQFRSTRTEDQNPPLIPKPGKLKPVDMNKGAGSRPFPKPLMVKPNFTVKSLETRFNPPVSSNWANGESGRDAFGAKLANREQENSYTEAPSTGARPWTAAKPSVVQKPAFHKDISAAPETATDDLSVPKTKPLPGVFALGKCPAKPERPPHVNLNKFRGNVSNTDPELDPGISSLPPPPERLSITSVTPPPPLDFTLPPPPPPMDHTLQEDLYDDTDTLNRTQTSLGKGSNDHESAKEPASQKEMKESGEEIYEDLDHNQPEDNKETMEEKTTKESKELKKKLEKEEKKRLEQEKKEKKEREKRQQEARKKFKIKDMIAVVDTVKARVDHKGGKNKLPLKQGETIEIVRKTENPKDYWLARNTEGHYGFVKPDTLDVRGEVRHTPDEQEVYDDVGAGDEVNNLPDGVECEDDIYECAEDTVADFSFLPPPPPSDFELNAVDPADDTYDDVNPTDFPPPPPLCSNPKFSSTSETNVMDPKKKKKFEKEEKEFRKKFKYNAEIKVLYQATVLPSLSMKKFGNKDLPIKPGETIDVIVHPADDKLICRNSEGKFGYVSNANLEQDGSIYDDLDECIYDND